MVVVALYRPMNLAGPIAIERGVERFLGAGLPDRPSDPEDGGLAPLSRSVAKRLKRGERIVDEDVGTADRLRHDGPRSPRREGAVDEPVTVMDRARHRHEQVAALNLPA